LNNSTKPLNLAPNTPMHSITRYTYLALKKYDQALAEFTRA
jgi:hypothetical protein